MRSAAILSVTFLLAGCGDKTTVSTRGDTGGTLVISATADPGTLFPPLLLTTQAKQITEQIYDYLADVGPELNTHGDGGFRGELAERWEWSADSLSIAFHLNPRARWHDGKPVTAGDVRFTFNLYREPRIASRSREDVMEIDSVTARDSLTPVFWFSRRSSTQFLNAAAQMLILPEHHLAGIPVDSLRTSSPAPIGSGRFRLKRWEKGVSVELVADAGNYRGRARLDRVIWRVSPNFTTAVTKLFQGEADLFEPLRPDNIPELEKHPDLRAITLPGFDYVFLQFNLRDPANKTRSHPILGDRSVRRAIALSLDREALVRSLFDTLASVPAGPAIRAHPTTDPSLRQIPFDPAAAARLLDSLGWRARRNNGVRTKGGRELGFSVLIPSISTNRVRMSVLLQAQLRRSGIRLDLDQMDFPAYMDRLISGRFDAALHSWTLGASPSGTRSAWTTSGLGKTGLNYGSYSNPGFDAQLDSALAADNLEVAHRHASRAYTIINDDAPAIWLYEPRNVIGIHRRIRTTPMRPGAWWTDLASWWIPAGERLPRDQVGPIN